MSNIFDKDIDIRKYIEDRLLEIPNLKSRRDFHDLMLSAFASLFEEIEAKYDDLEYRVLNEMQHYRYTPELITTIISKDRYDSTDRFMYPMRQSDLEDVPIDNSKLMESLSKGEGYFVKEVYIALKPSAIKQIVMQKPVFNGKIITEHGEFSGKFRLVFDEWYLEKANSLYPVTLSNFIGWRCLCVPYLHKMFRLEVIQIDGFDIEEKINDIHIDFGEYKNVVCENQIPCWNISSINLKTSTYPEPCIDKVNYEHIIFNSNLNPNSQYMVYNRDVVVNNIRWLDGDMIITTPNSDPVIWQLYEFHKKSAEMRYANPLMSNGILESVADKISSYYGIKIRSILEIRRVLACQKVNGPELHSFAVLEDSDFPKETYFPNEFIPDKVRAMSKKSFMVFKFMPMDSGNHSYLDYDIISYYMGILQEYFPDYECHGVILEKNVPKDYNYYIG